MCVRVCACEVVGDECARGWSGKTKRPHIQHILWIALNIGLRNALDVGSRLLNIGPTFKKLVFGMRHRTNRSEIMSEILSRDRSASAFSALPVSIFATFKGS